MPDMDLAAIEAVRARLHAEYIPDERPPSSARGIHHTALLSSDVERTIRFYQGILEFPLTEIIENRDYQGSSHFFFDVGHGNLLAFFDFPGLDLGDPGELAPPARQAGRGRRPLPGRKRHIAVLPRPRRRSPGTPGRPPGRDVRQPRAVTPARGRTRRVPGPADQPRSSALDAEQHGDDQFPRVHGEAGA